MSSGWVCSVEGDNILMEIQSISLQLMRLLFSQVKSSQVLSFPNDLT